MAALQLFNLGGSEACSPGNVDDFRCSEAYREAHRAS